MSWLALSECVRLLRFASNSLRVNTSNKPNLSAPPQTITLAIRWSQSLPNDCDKPPAPHCCYTGHHGNCFHKGSRGMSCVSYFLASLLLLGDLLHCGGPGTERRRRSCAENTDPHTASLMDTVQPGGKTETGVGKQGSAFKCPATESDFHRKTAVTSHLTFLNPIFSFIVCFGLFLSNFSVEHCMKNAEDQVYTTLTETCVVLLLKHNFCLCLHKQKHTLMLLPDPCLNGSRYYPEISPLSRVLFSSQHVVHTSGLSSSSFTWSSAVYYLTEHEWHQNNSRGSQAWLPQCSVCDWAEVCNADLPLTFGLHIRTNTRRPLI